MFTIKATNYRGLPNIHWEIPPGLSVLIGPNGAGKSTLLHSLSFLGIMVIDQKGLDVALRYSGGASTFLHKASTDKTISFEVTYRDLLWQLRFISDGGGISRYPYERIQYKQNPVFERIGGSPTGSWKGQEINIEEFSAIHSLLKYSQFPKKDFEAEDLFDLLVDLQVCSHYQLSTLKTGSKDSKDRAVEDDGANLFTVLRNWGDTLEGQEKKEFVIKTLQGIFPFFRNLGFDRGGDTIEGFFYHTKYLKEKFSMRAAPNGFLTAMIHLCAVAGSMENKIILIDDFENCLHPEAITKLLVAIEARAAEKNLSVVIATQSPQVVNFFDQKPEQVYIVDDRFPSAPTPLLTLRTREWLSYFKLGDKFMEGDFAGFSLEAP